MIAIWIAWAGVFVAGCFPMQEVGAQQPAVAAPQGVEPARDKPAGAEQQEGKREPFDPPGMLVLVGGGDYPEEARAAFAGFAGGSKARIVIVSTASESADTEGPEYWIEPWRKYQPESVEVVHTRDRAVADSEEFAAKFEQATGVWISGGDQAFLAAAYLNTRTQRAIEAVAGRGGAIGGTSAGAAIASRTMIADGREVPKMAEGFNLLQHAIVDQHFSQRSRETRLKKALEWHPGCVGIGIDEDTAVVFHRRSMKVIGPGAAHIHFAATTAHPATELTVRPGEDADWNSFLTMLDERVPQVPASGNAPDR